MRWTGPGAPFVFFFITVLISSFFWGAGPGFLAGFMSAPLSAFLFVYQAGYTLSQALAQSILFLTETSFVVVFADRFAKAKRRSELNERAASEARNRLENVNKLPRTFKQVLHNPGRFRSNRREEKESEQDLRCGIKRGHASRRLS